MADERAERDSGVGASVWRQFVDWLFKPRPAPLAVRLLQDEIGRLYDENRRLNNLLTQAYESRGVIPIQPERREPSPPVPVGYQTYAQVETDLGRQDREDFEAFRRMETERLEQLAEITREATKPH